MAPDITNTKIHSAKEITSENYKQFTIGRFPQIRILHTIDDVLIENPNANRVGAIKELSPNTYLIVRNPGSWDACQASKRDATTARLLASNPTLSQYLKSTHVIDGVYGLVVTSDDKIAAEKRSQEVANSKGGTSLPAGSCDFEELPIRTIKRELKEELNLSAGKYNLEPTPLTTVFVPKSLSLNHVYVARTPLTFAELRAEAETAKDRWEWEDLIPVDANPQAARDFALNRMTGKGSKVAMFALADYLEGK